MQALNRLMTILETVAQKGEPITAAEVAEATDLSISTVARLMQTMADSDVLHRSEHNRSYTLGPRVFGLVRAASTDLDIAQVARPALERLRDATEETASLHVMVGSDRLCVAVAESRHQVRRVVPVGFSGPLLPTTATGLVLLAGQPPHPRAEILDALKIPAGERGRLESEFEQVRERGWALKVDTWVQGLCGLAAAVRDTDSTRASLSVSGPSFRFDEDAAMSHIDTVLVAAEELSQALRSVSGPPVAVQ